MQRSIDRESLYQTFKILSKEIKAFFLGFVQLVKENKFVLTLIKYKKLNKILFKKIKKKKNKPHLNHF